MPLGKSSKVLFPSVENDQEQYVISRILGGKKKKSYFLPLFSTTRLCKRYRKYSIIFMIF